MVWRNWRRSNHIVGAFIEFISGDDESNKKKIIRFWRANSVKGKITLCTSRIDRGISNKSDVKPSL